MNYKIYIILLVFAALFVSCEKEWSNYYDQYPETVNETLWENLQQDAKISKFVELLKDYELDTLFQTDIPYTVFAPENDALDNYLAQNSISDILLGYHIITHFLQSGNIQGKRKVQTFTEKYALFERAGNDITVDGIGISSESPLYKNGKYYLMNDVLEPKPNLYEYFKITNPVLSDYIDTKDSIALDKEKSKPIGFDEFGNTIYDSVITIINTFERDYFPVNHEFRNLSGTIVFPRSEDYNNALNVMADALGDKFVDYRDIPQEWQYEILMPVLLNQGIFNNMREPEEFIWKSPKDTAKLLNAFGDSVVIYYTPVDKALCSNGYAYNYTDFTIPDSLYLGGTKVEGESLTDETGVNRFAWYDWVTVNSSIAVQPLEQYVNTASNDSIIRVVFPKGFTGQYSVQFKSPSLFPRKYVMVVRTHMDYGGIYDIYVNNELVKTFDYYEFLKLRGIIISVTGKTYVPEGRFNKFDMYVENVTEYGPVDIKFDYKGPGTVQNNGLVIDYIEFIPAEN